MCNKIISIILIVVTILVCASTAMAAPKKDLEDIEVVDKAVVNITIGNGISIPRTVITGINKDFASETADSKSDTKQIKTSMPENNNSSTTVNSKTNNNNTSVNKTVIKTTRTPEYDLNRLTKKTVTGIESDSKIFSRAYNGARLNIPALMYHKVTDNPDEVTDYVVTGDMLAKDFAEINLRGYSPITVSEYYELAELAKDINNKDNYTKLSDFFKINPKPIIITFDDGYKGIYTHVLPLMKKYDFKVNFYICGELIDTENPEYCTWDEIKMLSESGLAEIGNHTYALHAKSKEELSALYASEINIALDDISKNQKLITEVTGKDVKVFSFPYGQYDNLTLHALRTNEYECFISTDYRANQLTDKKTTLGRANRSGLIPTKEYFNMIDQLCGYKYEIYN